MRRRTLLSGGGINIDPTTGRGTIGDYEVVDLGLSNGLLFATWNVGATKESDYGNYYQWGAGSTTYQKTRQFHTGGTNSDYTLPSSADTATQVMGEGWRMPTYEEFEDLVAKTDYSWTNINRIVGGKFTSRTNPNAYVFFPAAGYYGNGSFDNEGSCGYVWSSTPYDSSEAYRSYFLRGYKGLLNDYRNCGLSVRGVHAAV